MNSADAAQAISLFYGSPLSVISDCLRGFVIPRQGYDFIAADFNAIESRVLNWLAGQDNVLEVFRQGGDIYVENYSAMFGVPRDTVDKEQRQIGKVSELSLGYQGGVRAFQMMARNYGVKVADKRAEEIKTAFRQARPRVVEYWSAMEKAAISAVLQPGSKVSAGPFDRRVVFKKAGSFLWCQLPSKRVLCYPYPEIQEAQTPWGDVKDQLTFMGEDSLTHKWERQKTYGGSLVENVTQGVSRDLLVEAFFRLEDRNYPVVMHVHDEIVCEVPEWAGSVSEMEKIMEEVPAWAVGLPIKASGWRGKRYKK